MRSGDGPRGAAPVWKAAVIGAAGSSASTSSMLVGKLSGRSARAATLSSRSMHCQSSRNWRSEIWPVVSKRLMVDGGTVLCSERAARERSCARRRSRRVAASRACTSCAESRDKRSMSGAFGHHVVQIYPIWSILDTILSPALSLPRPCRRGPCAAGPSRSRSPGPIPWVHERRPPTCRCPPPGRRRSSRYTGRTRRTRSSAPPS